jgi:capsular polysaccharide biosynthesis protein
VGIQETNYKKYFDKLEQARIDHALEMVKISNISVVQPATYPIKPVRPKKLLNIALGLFLGIFGAIGLAFISEYMDHTFKKPEDITQILDLPILATIPKK